MIDCIDQGDCNLLISKNQCSAQQVQDFLQKQSFAEVLQKRFSFKFRNIHRKAFVLESFRPAALLKEIPTQLISCEICEIFKNSFFC